MNNKEIIGVIGLGYVGMPLAISLSKNYDSIVAYDRNKNRVMSLKSGIDANKQFSEKEIINSRLNITDNPESLREVTFYIITVPTPVDATNQPDLSPVISATEMVGEYISHGDIVIYESTVYPGVTEEICGPLLEKKSSLKRGVDFKLGYSPERVNPGDNEHTIEKITKVISAEDEDSLERVAAIYGQIIEAGIFKAKSIRIAEAAKVIENIQRDINIALMNELSIIFERLEISTRDVLAAAGTKWNFLKFTPGLVGGHCISVDPYYLTSKAEEVGYHPEIILAGRRINDSIGRFVAQKTIKMMNKTGVVAREARVAILGIAFKENVPDIRNSKVIDIIEEFKEYSVSVMVYDPLVNEDEVKEEYGIVLTEWNKLNEMDVVVLAVPHDCIMAIGFKGLLLSLKDNGVFIDIKSAVDPVNIPAGITYWSL